MKLATSIIAASACLHTVIAHGSHGSANEEPKPDDWALWHLEEEHHISNFDAASFFTLHDFNNDGIWTEDEIRRTYGMDDASLKDIPGEQKTDAVKQVLSLFDPEGNGRITRLQFAKYSMDGNKLPDFGFGPGHHGDIEYEYEIHHFEKFHGSDTTEEDLVHPEDIEHFRMHDMLEDEQERIAVEQSQSIVEANIPMKFRKQQ
ncbi:hypothetical protein LTR70_007152 [Exophiala xenobiotica]|uniref:Uncharacterized protein n=1 Tax=Lithohypha guttulata TaxID=1690604 RepID=A0ABR0KFE2_9EURO|nr:hypothetical protein LTR24_003239 [Lithohypha guttulata]KAK5314437.1 hypothetical protein LTR70_007152 [Exophiala xenobiotica]